MAKRGRPPKPLEDHVRDGTYRPKRHGGVPDTDPVAGPPPKPAKLSAEESAEWDLIVPGLAHLLRPRDLPLLVELVAWLAEVARIKAALAAKRPGQKGYCMMLNAHATATGVLLTLSQRFGLTPGDRGKMKVVANTSSASAKPKVATRPRTALDAAPPPEVAG